MLLMLSAGTAGSNREMSSESWWSHTAKESDKEPSARQSLTVPQLSLTTTRSVL